MPVIGMTHFEATLLFALVVSAVMGVTGRKTDSERLRYGLKCFGYFLATVFVLGWLMRLGHG
jgi:hypothetical protein